MIVVAVGKAGWEMGKAAEEVLGNKIDTGIVVTKHGHSHGEIPGFTIMEASHPVLDESSLQATEKVLEAVADLDEKDTVLFLLSGGGSALLKNHWFLWKSLRIFQSSFWHAELTL